MQGFTGTINGIHACTGDFIDFSACLLGFVALHYFWVRKVSGVLVIVWKFLASAIITKLIIIGGRSYPCGDFCQPDCSVVCGSSAISGAPEATLMKVASLGYAVPGTVLAIGLLTRVCRWIIYWPNCSIIVVYCSLRGFISYLLFYPLYGDFSQGDWCGLTRIYSAGMEQASRLLGESESGTFFRVHLPLLRPALVTGAGFADVMKSYRLLYYFVRLTLKH